jgi:hypothetical protein
MNDTQRPWKWPAVEGIDDAVRRATARINARNEKVAREVGATVGVARMSDDEIAAVIWVGETA